VVGKRSVGRGRLRLGVAVEGSRVGRLIVGSNADGNKVERPMFESRGARGFRLRLGTMGEAMNRLAVAGNAVMLVTVWEYMVVSHDADGEVKLVD
jgi:hypothetical protein